MTTKEADREYRRLYKRLRKVGGYQMFGMHWNTIRITHPQIAKRMAALIKLHPEIVEG